MSSEPFKAQSLYPTCQSTDEAVSEAVSRLPIRTHNELIAVLGLYHNSLRQAIINDQEKKT